MFNLFRKKSPQSATEEFHGIMVNLHVSGELSLFIMLAVDGNINRVGTGAVDNTDRDMYIGRTDSTIFFRLREQITSELLAFCGKSRADPDPKGEVCELTVGFKKANGEEMLMDWRYGSESLGPPTEVGKFVVAAVRATDPWFEKHIGRTEANV